MSAVRVMVRRTLVKSFGAFTTMGAVAAFVSAASASFFLELGRGGTSPVPALWAVAAVPWLQVLAAFATMRLLAEERLEGRMDLLLTAPVRELSVVVGKFLGAWGVSVAALLLFMAVPLLLLPRFAPSFSPAPGLVEFLPALAALLLQAALWNAAGIFASACFRQPATAAVVMVGATVAVPWAAWRAALAFSPALRASFPDHPFLADAYDLATGVVSLEPVVFYMTFTGAALFSAGKAMAFCRMAGRGARLLRFSTVATIVLAWVFASLTCLCARRADISLNVSYFRPRADDVSARTRQLLSSIDGEIRVTCFLSARSPAFRPARRLLRGIAAAAAEQSGVRLVVDTVDPRWDLAAAARLVREGVPEGTLFFQRGRRRVAVPAQDANEAACASALLRIALPARRETVYWTRGHGETQFDSHDVLYGMSDFARDLRRDGYEIKPLDVSAAPSLPADCALLVVAGAREAFSKDELRRVDGYLRHGGRLLVMATGDANAGVGSLLTAWGLKIMPFTAVSPRTVGGADLAVTDLGDHVITRPLSGTTLLFGAASPLAEATPGDAASRDNLTFTPLARTDSRAWGESDVSVLPWTYDSESEPAGPLVLAAALERGANAGANLAFRPTRVVIVGDAAFALNGALASRANANRDFMMNAIAWLAGLDAATAPGIPGNVIVTGLERPGWLRLGAASCIGLPVLPLLMAAFLRFRRRRPPLHAKAGGDE